MEWTVTQRDIGRSFGGNVGVIGPEHIGRIIVIVNGLATWKGQ